MSKTKEPAGEDILSALYPAEGGRRLPGEPATGAPLDPLGSSSAKSDPGGFAHLKQLDGLRGMAIGLILLYHLLWANEQTTSRILSLFIRLKDSLWIGVDLFFALSGFLITGILFDALHSKHFLRNFYGRRCVRIFPLYFLALGILGLLTHRFDIHWGGFQWYLIFYLANSPTWQLHLPGSLLVASHLWSLSTEEQFYLVWPFVVLFVQDRRRLMNTALLLSAIALIVRIVLVLHGTPANLTYTMLPMRMDGLLIAGWLALAIRGPEREAVLRKGWLVLLGSGLVILAIAFWQHGLIWETSHTINAVGYTFTALASTGLIAITLSPAGWARSFFSLSPLRALGRYSYGIYVWHPIIEALMLLQLRAFAAQFTDSRILRVLFSFAIVTALSILTGVLSYHLFEVHFLRLKKYFAYGR